MAFFNLWSSERLSFSLSIIAVVSAAITTFHQFYSKTDVKVTFSAFEYTVNDTTGTGILKLSGIFMNNGTTPVALKESSVFFSIDTTKNNGKVNGWQSHYLDEWRLYEYSSILENVLDGVYVAPGSAEAFNVEWQFEPSRVLQLVEVARRNQQFSVWDSTLVTVDIGLFATLVSPQAEYSSKRVYPITQWFDVSDTLNPKPTISGISGNGFYTFEIWEPMEENWEPKEVATDPT